MYIYIRFYVFTTSSFVLFCTGFIVFNSAGFRSSQLRQGPINFFFYVNVRVRRDLSVFEGFYYYFSPRQTNYHNANTTFKISHLEFHRLFRGFTLLRLYTYYCYVYRYRCALTHSKRELLYISLFYTIVRLLLRRRNSCRTPPPLANVPNY